MLYLDIVCSHYMFHHFVCVVWLHDCINEHWFFQLSIRLHLPHHVCLQQNLRNLHIWYQDVVTFAICTSHGNKINLARRLLGVYEFVSRFENQISENSILDQNLITLSILHYLHLHCTLVRVSLTGETILLIAVITLYMGFFITLTKNHDKQTPSLHHAHGCCAPVGLANKTLFSTILYVPLTFFLRFKCRWISLVLFKCILHIN